MTDKDKCRRTQTDKEEAKRKDRKTEHKYRHKIQRNKEYRIQTNRQIQNTDEIQNTNGVQDTDGIQIQTIQTVRYKIETDYKYRIQLQTVQSEYNYRIQNADEMQNTDSTNTYRIKTDSKDNAIQNTDRIQIHNTEYRRNPKYRLNTNTNRIQTGNTCSAIIIQTEYKHRIQLQTMQIIQAIQ